MKKENTAKYILRLTATLLTICAVVALALAGVNAITAKKIAENKEQKTKEALQQVLPGATAFEEIAFTDETGMVTKVYKTEGVGYAVEVVPSGFGGDITMMVGVSLEGKVLGTAIISHAETPGLGAVAAADTDKGSSFREQFKGLIAGIAIGKEPDKNQVSAITGATITSQAVVDGVNAALECVKNLG